MTEQIHQSEQELAYIDSVSEALGRAENERDLSEIRQELAEQGYLHQHKTKGKQKNTAPAAPMKFITSDGFTVLVGRNNRQNDKLTLKDANNHDMWLHVKNIPQGNYRTSHFGSCADCSLLQQGKRFITGSC